MPGGLARPGLARPGLASSRHWRSLRRLDVQASMSGRAAPFESHRKAVQHMFAHLERQVDEAVAQLSDQGLHRTPGYPRTREFDRNTTRALMRPTIQMAGGRWLALAFLFVGCAQESPRESIEDYLPFAEDARWTYAVVRDSQAFDLEVVAEGGDVRELGGERVRFQFAYGTPAGEEHDITKSIYAMPASGPREFYLDAMTWALFHDPPIPLLPAGAELHAGPSWPWEGRVEFAEVEEASRATSTLLGFVDVRVPAGSYRALHTHTVYQPSGLQVSRWMVRGIGLVKVEVRSDDHSAGLALRAYASPREVSER